MGSRCPLPQALTTEPQVKPSARVISSMTCVGWCSSIYANDVSRPSSALLPPSKGLTEGSRFIRRHRVSIDASSTTTRQAQIELLIRSEAILEQAIPGGFRRLGRSAPC